MAETVAIVVLSFNEAPMLRWTLARMKACADQVIVVDMGSTDGSAAIYDEVLGPQDRVVVYEQRYLPLFGFGHARNYGARFATTDWILVVDSDELIDLDSMRDWRADLTAGHDVLELARHNYLPGAWKGDVALTPDEIMATATFTRETQRRIYRNGPAMRWEGLIHEEIFDGQGNTWGRTGPSRLLLHHFSFFKSVVNMAEKHELYSYLILRMVVTPGFRWGTNPYWYTTYPQAHLGELLTAANSFAQRMSLPALHRAELEALLSSASEPVAVGH